MKILLCAAEVVPFAKTGGLADVAGSLPKALAALGHEVRVVLPKYGSLDEKRFSAKKIADNIPVPVGEQQEKAAVWQTPFQDGFCAYFIDNHARFGQAPLYGHADDAERFIFYQRAVLAMLAGLDWKPEALHCNDWQSGLLPLYVHLDRRPLATIYTLHNLAYQGNFGPEALKTAGLPPELFTPEKLEFYGDFSFMKAGLLYADIITTVSPTYAQEIQTPEFGERLEGVLSSRRERLRGIINGIDIEVWDPAHDAHLASAYNATSLPGKTACKQALQARLGLAQSDAPLIGIVSRLAAQKGFDLLEEVLPHLLKLGVQLAVLGVGEQHYHDLFQRAAKEDPKAVSINLEFNDELAHQIYAGTDMFLMPSRYEPCGLGQMISLRYGSVPIVRSTGGLADTVEESDSAAGQGNGFCFKDYSAVALFGAVTRALVAYQNKKAWRELTKRGMKGDFSWQASAKKYVEVYKEALQLRKKRP